MPVFPKSIWSADTAVARRAPLSRDISVNTVIIGAGMAGVLTGYELAKRGVSVAIIERDRIASGVTKDTTAKVTAQHGLVYRRLIAEIGENQARQYAAANARAVERYAEIIGSRGIGCDFERLPAYVYSLDQTDELYAEVKAACSLGLDAEFTTDSALPFPVKGAVRFPNQAQMNPLKFIRGVARDLEIYEDSEVLEVSHDCVTTKGGKAFAKNIVVATHYPFINSPGYYFLRMHQQRSYALALENTGAKLDGMYIDADNMGFSFRGYDNLTILGGEGHRTGQNENGGHYAKLRQKAAEFYPGSQVVHEWSAQDCMTLDGVPYIGRYSSSTPNIFVATGFNKWGMTSSMVSALVLSALITGEDCDFAAVFSPQRFNAAASTGNLLRDGMKSAKNLIAGAFASPRGNIDELEPGHGGIVEYDGQKVGVYKNEKGEAFIVSPKCTHLGCQLEWNPDELTWDCPCHGSRFGYDGHVIEPPASEPLPRY